jgi:pimeloyl-ACP methyl ester carboxylesterase
MDALFWRADDFHGEMCVADAFSVLCRRWMSGAFSSAGGLSNIMRSVFAASFAGLVVMALCDGAAAGPVAATVPPAIAAEYVRPHERVDIGGGRKMNLFCMGSSGRTVIFDSGLSDWSSIWALVQPGVAARARACTYDRAGMGYSDPSDAPRAPIAIVEDLHKLIRAAKIATPVVLVGHSLGGFNMKLYAALYPDDVAGLVLVDPAEERTYARTRSLLRAKFGAALAAELELSDLNDVSGAIARYDGCAAAAHVHDLDPASTLYKHCTDPVRPPLGPQIAAERQKIQVKKAYQDTQASELANSVYGDARSDGAYAALFSGHALGNKPLIVLTHSIYDPKDRMSAANFFAWNAVHEQTAALSTQGVNRIVPETHHNIEVDRPQAIVDAVNEVLGNVAEK